jgi:hypothetical protein
MLSSVRSVIGSSHVGRDKGFVSMRKTGKGRQAQEAASVGGDLMLAPMVAMMRLPLMAMDAQSNRPWSTETARGEREDGCSGGRCSRGADVLPSVGVAVLARVLFRPHPLAFQRCCG